MAKDGKKPTAEQALVRELAELIAETGLTEIEIETDDTRRRAANDASDRGVITRGEYRERQGFSPLPEADEGADLQPGQVPYGWNAELIARRCQPPDAAYPSAVGVPWGGIDVIGIERHAVVGELGRAIFAVEESELAGQVGWEGNRIAG